MREIFAGMRLTHILRMTDMSSGLSYDQLGLFNVDDAASVMSVLFWYVGHSRKNN